MAMSLWLASHRDNIRESCQPPSRSTWGSSRNIGSGTSSEGTSRASMTLSRSPRLSSRLGAERSRRRHTVNGVSSPASLPL